MIKKIDFERIKIKTLSQNDLKKAKEFQEHINSLIEEEAMILLDQKQTLKEEQEWLKNELKNIKRKVQVMLIAQDGNKIVGISEIKLKRGKESHVGELGISVRKKYRGREFFGCSRYPDCDYSSWKDPKVISQNVQLDA